MSRVSLIIPVYNSVEYLERCLESAVKQTHKDMEIICVDDGSTDGSEKLVDFFAKKDKRIVSIHQDNHGESNARNVGLSAATGKYIGFMDCDDWIELDMYECLVDAAEADDLDIAAAGYYRETEETCIEINNTVSIEDMIFGRDELLRYLYMRDSYRGFGFMWNKLYRRDIICGKQGKSVSFDENLVLGGDVLFLAEAALNVKRAKYIDRPFYHYRLREDSSWHTKDTKKLRHWIKAYEQVIEKFESIGISDDILGYVKRLMVYNSSLIVETAYEQKDKSLKIFQELMRRYEEEYLALNCQFPERIVRYEKILKYSI